MPECTAVKEHLAVILFCIDTANVLSLLEKPYAFVYWKYD
jgi:hypothetical protein